jgi:hypothetical protein
MSETATRARVRLGVSRFWLKRCVLLLTQAGVPGPVACGADVLLAALAAP